MTDNKRSMFRALDLLLNEHVPTLKRRNPYWAPRPAVCWREIHVPAWRWFHVSYEPDVDTEVTFLDRTASWVSAASSAQYAHGALERTGALPGYGRRPGYYLVDAHPWQDHRIVSPLGTADTEARVWVTYPTLEILQRLTEDGVWPGVTIHDSWTCPDSVRFRAWATAVNQVRVEAHRDVQAAMMDGTEADQAEAEDHYENYVKAGYAVAFETMRGNDDPREAKSKVRRPDWYQTTVAQAAANVWRDTWKCVQAGYQPLFMGAKDEVAYLTEDVRAMMRTTPPVLKIDTTGVQLGHWKVKPRAVVTS
ncbi:hypothetical protein [Streptomyces sp. NBC_00470]|uniref:hypothetical protein n=1 Tax=Streptomyces sp. NBC_00470 TaxID=2975753 RepID=UPI0030E2E448